MTARKPRRPPVYLVLLVDRGRVAAHLADRRTSRSLCGLDVGPAEPLPDSRRITCVSCARLVRYAGAWRS